MDAADVADERIVQKDPHIVVTEERVFQRPDIVRRQREFDGILHAEEGVVRLPVVADRKRCGFIGPASADAVSTCIALIIDRITVTAEERVFLFFRRVQRPEVVCVNMRVRRTGAGRRIEELVQPVDGAKPCDAGRGERMGIAHLLERQTAAGIGVLAVGVAVVEELRRNDIVVVNDFTVLKRLCDPERTAIILAAVAVQINTGKLVVAHTGAAVRVAEGQHITVRIPFSLTVRAGSVVPLRIDARDAG